MKEDWAPASALSQAVELSKIWSLPFRVQGRKKLHKEAR